MTDAEALGRLSGEVLFFLAIIFIAFLWGALPLVHAFHHTRRESEGLDAVESFRDGVAGDTAGRLTARTSIEAEMSAAELGGTATAGRVHSLAHLVKHGLPLDRSALTAASEERLSEHLRRPRSVSSLLILIGLAGTLFGLTQAVLGLGSFGGVPSAVQEDGGLAVEQLIQRQSAIIDQLLESIQATLGGMQTAFLPALTAVGLTVLLLVALHSVQAMLDRAAARLEVLTDEILLPLYRPGAQDRLQEAQFLAFRASESMVTASERTATVLATALDRMEARMAGASAAAADVVTAGSRDTLESLQAFMAETRAAANETGRLLTAGAKAAAGQFTSAATVAAQSAEAVQKRMLKSTERLDATATELSAAVVAASTAASGIAEALSIGGHVAERLSEAEAQHQQTVRLITDQVRTAQQEATRVTETSARLAEALQNLDQTRLAMRDLVALQQQWHRDTLNAVASNTQRAEEGVTGIRDAVERIEDASRTLGDRIQQVRLPDPAQRDQRLMDYLADVIKAQNHLNEDRWGELMRKLDARRAIAVPRAVGANETGREPIPRRASAGHGVGGRGVLPAFLDRIRSRFR